MTYLDILCNPIKEHRSPTEPLEYSLHHKKTLTEDTNSVPSSCPSDIPMSKPSRFTFSTPFFEIPQSEPSSLLFIDLSQETS